MPSIKLKNGIRSRALQGHPWVFSSEVQKLLSSENDGEVIECRDARGYLLGSGIYNSRSKIIWRRFSREKSALDTVALLKLIKRAIEKRKNEDVRRLVWSESDDLPGLVVDQYGKILVVQTLTLGMDRRLESIVQILISLLKPESIVVRNDVFSRKLEGLEEKIFVAHGDEPDAQWMKIGDIEFHIDVMEGQKTGFYLDQREQHTLVASFAKGRAVLDTFCNQGGFALHCAKAGAKEILGVDISSEAIEQARENAKWNQLDASFEAANVFDFFHAKKNKSWDMIVLDPPPFAKTKEKIQDAARGYKELNLRAMQLLPVGGILATYCCSHHITKQIFEEILADAATDAKRSVRVLARCSQPLDHPIVLGIPESEYLTGLILEI